ncbi:MAG: sugar MFS transporter [Balneolales bacterium]|nr:sugar MFS transporter [Balneolales bacterium]
MGEKNKYLVPFIVITSLFFMWGFITVLVDALIPRLRDVFELTYFQAGIVQFAFFTAYAVFSIPGGYLISRIGYKNGAIVGLITMGIACALFYPAASFRIFGIFLAAMFVLAGGITILQVAANPYVAALGPSKTASSRLNLAQAFNSLGTTIAPLVSAAFILSSSVLTSSEIDALSETDRLSYFATEASAVQGPFIVLGVVLIGLALVFSAFKLPNILEGDEHQHGNYRSALKKRHLTFGALGIFVYVGAEVAIGSYLVNYFLNLDVQSLVEGSAFMTGAATFLSRIFSNVQLSEMSVAQLAGTFVFFYWGGAMVGRFIGSAILQKVKAGNLLATYAGVNITLLLISMTTGGYVAMWSILCIGLFNSIMFPNIFTLSIKNLGEHTAQGSGILCTAIVGGAFIPPLYGRIADSIGLQSALFFVAICYAYILWYGKFGSNLDQPESA